MITRFAIALLVVGFAVSLGVRFDALGDRPLADDEYYTGRSVENVLAKGLPEFPSGGYYTQGLVPQYLAAGSALVLGKTPLAYRLPAALCALLAIVFTYVYARRDLEPALAAAVALCLALSSWHVEFARFGRMYAALQLVTLFFLIRFHHAYLTSPARGRYLPHGLVVLAVLTHQIGVVLAPLLFVPLLPGVSEALPSRAARTRLLLASTAVIVFAASFVVTNFRNWGVVDPFPAGYTAARAGLLRLPAFPFWSVGGDRLASFGLVVGALALASSVLLVVSRRRPRLVVDVLVALLLIACVLHQLTVAALLLALLVLRYRVDRPGLHPRRRYLLLVLAGLCALGWLAIAFASPDWISRASTADAPVRSVLGALRVTFFAWPDFYQSSLLPWQAELPGMGLLAGAALAFALVTRLRDPIPSLVRHPAAPILWLIVALATLRTPYDTTRYAFMIYPSVLITIALCVQDLGGRLTGWLGVRRDGAIPAAIAFAALFAITDDFNPRHLAGVASEDVGLRLGRWQRFDRVWYGREDFESPALFVNSALDAGQSGTVLVVGEPPVSYYLAAEHAVYYARTDPRFGMSSRRRGTLDLWSDQRLLSTTEELSDFTRRGGLVWLIRPVEPQRHVFEPAGVWGERVIHSELAYTSRDDRIEVVRIDLATVEDRPTRIGSY